MELVLRQPNLDFPKEEHLFFHVGNDNFIAYFVPVDVLCDDLLRAYTRLEDATGLSSFRQVPQALRRAFPLRCTRDSCATGSSIYSRRYSYQATQTVSCSVRVSRR